MTYANGAVHEGVYQNGLPNGRGIMRKKNGETHIGDYLDGLLHGEGTVINRNGSRLTCKFQSGLPTEIKKEKTDPEEAYKTGNVFKG